MKFIARAGGVCWALIPVFLVLIVVASSGWAAFIALLTGSAILAWLGFYIRRQRREKKFEFGWFLVREGGLWIIITGIIGVVLFLSSAFVFLFPETVGEIGEKHVMRIAEAAVVSFWLALTLTTLHWTLVFYVESTAYLRLRKFRPALNSFGYGSLLLLISVCVVSIFLDVINDNFFQLSSRTQYITLAIFAFLTFCAGIVAGCFEDTKRLLETIKPERGSRK